MGKQYRKIVKRRRRAAYLARRKAALQEGKPKAKKPAKSTPARTSRKAVAKKATTNAATVGDGVMESMMAPTVMMLLDAGIRGGDPLWGLWAPGRARGPGRAGPQGLACVLWLRLRALGCGPGAP